MSRSPEKGGASKAQPARRIEKSSCCVLITGFGGFPGARFNPTGRLVKKLAHIRRPAFAQARIVTHVFSAHYAAVDRELPKLIRRYRPDVILMLGLAARSKHLCIETRARNALSILAPDAQGFAPHQREIRLGAPGDRRASTSSARALAGARGFGVRTKLSRDAGNYVCNYLYWSALEYSERMSKPPLLQFVHVPQIQNGGSRTQRANRPSFAKLAAALQALMAELIAQARRA
ncbi:MAG: pyroglutamyl-peptidase I [Pseudomonadota bacterium]|nr:pyroglutamyl-peptidase I [Pseudomonadota bacterium]